MSCVLLICSVIAIAAAFAEKGQYDNIINFRNHYTFQVISDRPDMEEELSMLIAQDNEISYHGCLPFFGMDGSHFSNGYSKGILAFSDVKKFENGQSGKCCHYFYFLCNILFPVGSFLSEERLSILTSRNPPEIISTAFY